MEPGPKHTLFKMGNQECLCRVQDPLSKPISNPQPEEALFYHRAHRQYARLTILPSNSILGWRRKDG